MLDRKKQIMGSQLQTGLSIGSGNEKPGPAATFVWDVTEADDDLNVTVSFGGGTDLSKGSQAKIPFLSTAAVDLVRSAGDVPIAEFVVGNVRADWTKDGSSYVVLFSGTMSVAGISPPQVYNASVSSSDQNSAPTGQLPLIVYARIGS